MCYEPMNEAAARACRERDEAKAELQKVIEELHEEKSEKSELEAAYDGAKLSMKALNEKLVQVTAERDALETALKRHPNRCEECEHERPSCNGDCEGCSPNCPCYFCWEIGSNFVLKGGT